MIFRRFLLVLPMVALVSGCSLFGTSYVTVKFNSWPIKYHQVNTIRIPQGLKCEMTLVEPMTIEIEGDIAAEINGRSIKVVEGVLWYNDRKYEMAEGDIVRIEEGGKFVSEQESGGGDAGGDAGQSE